MTNTRLVRSDRRALSATPAGFVTSAADREALRGLWATIDLAPIGICHFDINGHFLLVNQRLCDILGYSRKQLLDRTFQEISFTDDLPGCVAVLTRLVTGDIPTFNHVKRFVRADDSVVWTRISVSPVRDDKGELAFFTGIAEDVTEEHRTAVARGEAEERLRVALEASRTGTFRWDLRTNELAWDANLDALFGLAREQTVHTLDEFLALVHPDDRSRVAAACKLCARDGAGFDEEFRVTRADGAERWLCDKGQVFMDSGGRPLYMTGACIDVTGHRRIELDLRTAAQERERLQTLEQDARRHAEEATALRDEVLGIVAHDLRNPVHSILMSASAMLEPGVTSDQRRRHIGIIRRTARGMDRLIRDLLDVRRLEAGTLEVRMDIVDVTGLINETVEGFESEAQSRGLTLACDLGIGLPPVLGDHDRLVQVLSNLIGNALKFTPRGGHVGVHAHHVGSHVEISVTDDGPGIPPRTLARVFDRFWQADRRSPSGAGLGLAIARGIVDAHGGHIWVESIVDHGSAFRFTVPCVPPEHRFRAIDATHPAAPPPDADRAL